MFRKFTGKDSRSLKSVRQLRMLAETSEGWSGMAITVATAILKSKIGRIASIAGLDMLV